MQFLYNFSYQSTDLTNYEPVYLYTRIELLCKWMKDGGTQVLTVGLGDKQRGKGLGWNMEA